VVAGATYARSEPKTDTPEQAADSVLAALNAKNLAPTR
jgi:hypothetical protein